MSVPLVSIVTTIQPPTECMRKLAASLRLHDADLLVVGDKKGPDGYNLQGAELFTLEAQEKSPFSLADKLPTGHYARKNLGYLLAFQRRAACIYETDDDNAPNESWMPRSQRVTVRPADQRPWLNVYRLFSDEAIWPRGFPLRHLRNEQTYQENGHSETITLTAPIQQGLVNRTPDVDAIWRLVGDREVYFAQRPSVALPAGTWCPFNSQSTWWWSVAYPLMYLPSHCTFRMTDIWRSFIAQRCLWALGHQMVFHAPEVEQERNEHDLMRDFEHEVPGYLGNENLVALLDGLELAPGADAAGENLLFCYEKLVAAGYFPEKELELVRAWLHDVAQVCGKTIVVTVNK